MANSVIAPNRAKHALRDGQAIIGTMVAEIRQPAVMQLLANAGFDYVIIDNEHGPFNIETIADLSRTALYVGLTPIVRVPDLTYPYIAQALDSGAQGVMIPRITSVEQVQQAVQIVKYPPVGQRGSALTRGYTNFRGGSVVEVMTQANDETMVVIQIETRAALEQIDAIVAVPGVDVAFIGPNDLSIALGVPGQTTSPVLVSAIEAVMAACQRHGVTAAIQMNDLKLAVQWAQHSLKMISFSAETGLLMSAGLNATTAIRQAYPA
ncbi:MAG: aldolase/citrate lyase family protein [Caldilineaceae bacterium]